MLLLLAGVVALVVFNKQKPAPEMQVPAAQETEAGGETVAQLSSPPEVRTPGGHVYTPPSTTYGLVPENPGVTSSGNTGVVKPPVLVPPTVAQPPPSAAPAGPPPTLVISQPKDARPLNPTLSQGLPNTAPPPTKAQPSQPSFVGTAIPIPGLGGYQKPVFQPGGGLLTGPIKFK